MEIKFPKSVILSGAENASPARIEGSLPWSNAHKMVRSLAVFAARDDAFRHLM